MIPAIPASAAFMRAMKAFALVIAFSLALPASLSSCATSATMEYAEKPGPKSKQLVKVLIPAAIAFDVVTFPLSLWAIKRAYEPWGN
jgi:hypothetical protein